MRARDELTEAGEVAGQIDPGWLESIGLPQLLPDGLAPWRPLVEEAASFFLDRLPPDRVGSILFAQLALGHAASSAERLIALLSQCPTLHKLGQVIARQPRLDPVLRAHLQQLESMPAGVDVALLRERLREELGDALPVELGDEALAEGSVAVVLPFTYQDRGRNRQGVFKVLKSGIEARLADELGVLPSLASFLERRGAELGLPPLEYRDTLDSVRRLLTREIDLHGEQRHLREAAAFFAGDAEVCVPRVLRWCTPRVTAMERVFGDKVADAPLSSVQRRRLAATAVRALLAKPFWTSSDPVVFHGDLHGGNLLATEDGRLAVLDWSLVAQVSKRHREQLLSAALGGLTLDAERVRRAAAALARCPDDDPDLVAIVERALDRLVLSGRPPGFAWLLGLLDELALARATGFDEELALFRKSWLSLAGVLHDLDPQFAPDLPLIDVGLRMFSNEWPWRWFASSRTRGFATHVSNTDLLDLSASSWLTWLRYGARLQALGLQRLKAATSRDRRGEGVAEPAGTGE